MDNGWEKDYDDMFLWDTVNEGPSQKKGEKVPGSTPILKAMQSIQSPRMRKNKWNCGNGNINSLRNKSKNIRSIEKAIPG